MGKIPILRAMEMVELILVSFHVALALVPLLFEPLHGLPHSIRVVPRLVELALVHLIEELLRDIVDVSYVFDDSSIELVHVVELFFVNLLFGAPSSISIVGVPDS